MKINVTMDGTPEELNKVMDTLLEEGVEQSAEIDFEKLNYTDGTLDDEPPRVVEIEDIVMQHLEDLAKSIEKQSFEEFDNRTDCTGHFETEYNQGFCDGFDWSVEMLKREVGKQEVKVKLQDLVSSVEDSLEEAEREMLSLRESYYVLDRDIETLGGGLYKEGTVISLVSDDTYCITVAVEATGEHIVTGADRIRKVSGIHANT